MITDERPKAYKVEVEEKGCGECGEGKQWIVVGPDGCGQGVTYGDIDEAESVCEILNECYEKAFEAGYETRKEHEELEKVM